MTHTSDMPSPVEHAPDSTDALSARHCVGCGTLNSGRYCTRCGQVEVCGRHTLRSMTAGFLGRIMNLEQGLLHTIHGLTLRPGVVVRDYLAGSTVRYTHPAGYLLLTFAAFALAARFGGFNGSGSGNRTFVALLVPFIAAVSRLLFWRTRFNYAEHLIVVMYVVGHIALFLAILQPILPVVGPASARVIAFVPLVVGVGYFAWAYGRIFQSRPVLAAAGGLASLVGGAALWLIAVSMLLEMLRR